MNHVVWSKSCFGEFLVASDLVRRMAIGEEEYHPPLDCESGEAVSVDNPGVHHHIFVEFIDGYLLSDVRGMVIEFLSGGEYSVDIQVCRSPKSWLIYLSKEDYHPYLFNVRVCELSLFARSKHHAKVNYGNRRSVRRDDHFIMSTGQNARFVVGIIEDEIQRNRDRIIANRRYYEPNRRCNISNCIQASLQHLYIEGPPGYGKTELIDSISRNYRLWKAGEPGYFMFGTLNEDYDLVWFEDFDIMKMGLMMSTLLSLMDRKPVTISKKHEDDRTILFNGRFIFTSNYPIGDNAHFRRRVEHVYVSHKMFDCFGCVSDMVPVFNVDPVQALMDIEELISGDFGEAPVVEDQSEGARLFEDNVPDGLIYDGQGDGDWEEERSFLYD